MGATRKLQPCYWAPPAYNDSTYKCERLTDSAAFTPRDGCRREYFNGLYWLLGGWWPTNPPDGPNGWSLTNNDTNQVWSSPDLVNWTLELAHDENPPTSGPGARWKPIHDCMSWVWNGKLWMAGGDDQASGQNPDGSLRSDVWSSPDGTTWTREAELSPWGSGMGLWSPTGGLFNNELHVLGGARPQFGGQPINEWAATREHWKSADGVHWTQLPDMPFARAKVYRAPVLDGKMFMIGGGDIHDGNTFSDTWAFDGVYWRRMSSDSNGMWVGREWIAVDAYDGKLWAATGVHRETVENRTGFWMSRDLGRSWERMQFLWAESHADGICVGPEGLSLCTGRLQYSNVYLVSPS